MLGVMNEWMPLVEAAKYARTSRQTIYGMIRRGDVKVKKMAPRKEARKIGLLGRPAVNFVRPADVVKARRGYENSGLATKLRNVFTAAVSEWVRQ